MSSRLSLIETEKEQTGSRRNYVYMGQMVNFISRFYVNSYIWSSIMLTVILLHLPCLWCNGPLIFEFSHFSWRLCSVLHNATLLVNALYGSLWHDTQLWAVIAKLNLLCVSMYVSVCEWVCIADRWLIALQMTTMFFVFFLLLEHS